MLSRLLVLATLGLCCAVGAQERPLPDLLVTRFTGFFHRASVGPVLVLPQRSELSWEAPDHRAAGKARLFVLSPEQPGTPPADAAGEGRPVTFGNERHGISIPLRTGHLVVWLHDNWRVEVQVDRVEGGPGRPAPGAEAVALDTAERLERVLSGGPALVAPVLADGAQQGGASPAPPAAAVAAPVDAGKQGAVRLSLSWQVGDGALQALEAGCNRADLVAAAIALDAETAARAVSITWRRDGQTLLVTPLPPGAGATNVTVKLDMSAGGGLPPGAYELLVTSGDRVVAARSFTVGTAAAAPLTQPAPADIPGATVAGEPAAAIGELRLALAVGADLQVDGTATRFPSTAARLYVVFDYRGLAEGSALAAVWTPPGGGPATTVRLPVRSRQGRAACYLAPAPGTAFVAGEWTVTVSPVGATAPTATTRFTVQ